MDSCFFCSLPVLLSTDGIYVHIEHLSVSNEELDHLTEVQR